MYISSINWIPVLLLRFVFLFFRESSIWKERTDIHHPYHAVTTSLLSVISIRKNSRLYMIVLLLGLYLTIEGHF